MTNTNAAPIDTRGERVVTCGLLRGHRISRVLAYRVVRCPANMLHGDQTEIETRGTPKCFVCGTEMSPVKGRHGQWKLASDAGLDGRIVVSAVSEGRGF